MRDLLFTVAFGGVIVTGLGGVIGMVMEASYQWLKLFVAALFLFTCTGVVGLMLPGDEFHEECGVVGSSAADAAYVCVEVPNE